MQIKKLLTPYNLNRLGDTSRIKYIVIHYVGATGGAEANCRYYASKYIGASAHYYVGFNGEIWQSVEDGDIAWHCGAKSYRHPECRNSNSVGIEMCVRNKGSQTAESRDWYFEEATVQTAIELTRELMEKYGVPADHVIRVQDTVNRHVIQDSGLFTLMFGAGKGQTQTLESLTEWQDKLIAFVQQNNLRCTCVELDCQKVLGVREAWYFRERMKKLLDNPQINVFHFEDGMRGLDSMIDFSDYIALSIPELRIIKPKTFREDTRYLTHYIKNRKPEIDIHLLGCTDVKMIAQNSFCTSADSTSWLSGVKYGWFDDGNQKAHINQFRKDLIEQRLSAVRTITEGRGLELTDKTLLYGARASLCATICKQKYTRAVGSQE